MPQLCRECGGSSFTVEMGVKMCNQCGMEQRGYMELQSQESMGCIDTSRMIFAKRPIEEDNSEDEDKDKDEPGTQKEENLNSWTTYEAFNIILHKWTKALCNLGASSEFQLTVLRLWASYLRQLEVAFLPHSDCSTAQIPKASFLPNHRDIHLLHHGHRSMSPSLFSVQSGSKGRKRKASESTDLDNFRKKVERKKFNKMKRGADGNSSIISHTVASELSRSLMELETSSCHDLSVASWENDTATTSEGGKRKQKTSSYDNDEDSESSVAPTSGGSLFSSTRSVVHRASFVRNWLDNRPSIYNPSHSSLDEDNDLEEGEPKKSNCSSRRSNRCNSRSVRSSERLSSQRSRGRTSSASLVSCKSGVPYSWYSLEYQAQLTHSQKRNLRERNPMHLSFNNLLPLLYLAVLLTKEDILLMDIIRWCREGHIPFKSAQYLLPASMPLCYSDKFIFKSNKVVPSAEEVQGLAGRLALFLHIQKIPLPPVEDVLTKLIKTLNLPESVGNVAQDLCTQLYLKLGGPAPSTTTMGLPPVECLAAAGVVIALKLLCGLNGLTEHQLSFVADDVEEERDGGQQGQFKTKSNLCHLFSWNSWQRHMCRVMWLCGKVDPVSSEHFHSLLPSQPRTHTSLFTHYHWSQAIWELPRLKVKKKPKQILELIINKILKVQGKNLNEMIAVPALYQASHLPFISIIQQFVNQFHRHTEPDLQDLVKIGEKLLNKSFTFQCVDWVDKLPHLQEQLKVQGSKRKVHPATIWQKNVSGAKKYFKMSEDPTNLSSPTHIIKNIKKGIYHVPQPLEMSWKISDIIEHWRTEDWYRLPANFRWLVSLVSRVCETSERHVLWMARKLESLTIT
ncbi:hypothetical protein Pmani_033052 [Petrolisthes manimaculis]|uniref:Rrn7/TAF1B C-terminal cyclin domain-containing protein n=1 Tax=Petrolisthes manimaculis TaxID=1843537 RepID=A0AAE1NSD1_9EUCA|nr:hypothetical protein Pmani_033052 [Petrolisthes manimaculis]